MRRDINMRWRATLALVAILATGPSLSADYRGEVTDVDPAGGKVTLRHGAIEKLEMKPMTMGYRVADPRMLEGIKVGDHVTFDVSGSDDGYTVTKLHKVN